MKTLCFIGLTFLMSCSDNPKKNEILRDFNCPAVLGIADNMVSNKLSRDARVVTFRLNDDEFSHFKSNVDKCGYSEWVSGGVSYGHLDVGWGNREKLIYSEKRIKGVNYLIAYDLNERLLHLIKFPSFE